MIKKLFIISTLLLIAFISFNASAGVTFLPDNKDAGSEKPE